MSIRVFPFVPTKSSEIDNGDFYCIPLSNGRFACGRILLIKKKSGRKTKLVLVGLHNWHGENYPCKSDIDKCELIEQGVMHVNSIAQVGGEVVGHKPLKEDNLKPISQFEAGSLLDGFENLGEIPVEDYKKYSRRTTYGFDVIRLLAEKHFVENS